MFDLNRVTSIKINKNILALISIFVIAAVLRITFFNGLNWDDDPDYVFRAYLIKTGKAFIFKDNNGFRIGTYYPAAIFYTLFGINDFACGSYALLVSLISIVAVFYLGKLLFNVHTGLIAALLLAFYPLDVELASRLLPDGLLSGFSLFAMYFLYRAEINNLNSNSSSLKSPWLYVVSGLILGWCTLVNMSAVVLIIFITVYFMVSLVTFRKKIQAAGLIKGFCKVVAVRLLLLMAGFLIVAGIEGACYYKVTGDYFYKYHNTLTHYAGEHAFCKDLSMYPQLMFH